MAENVADLSKEQAWAVGSSSADATERTLEVIPESADIALAARSSEPAEGTRRDPTGVSGMSTGAVLGARSLDWGIKELALDPGTIEANRQIRERSGPVFEDLPATASTMFARLEQHVGPNNLVPAYWLEEGAARSRTACKIEASGVDYKNRSGAWSGTGFLVAPGILCTNHHVINSRDVANRSRALFDFAATPDGNVKSVAAFRLRPDILFWTSPVVTAEGKGGLDATFVAVQGDPGATFGVNPLLRQSFAAGDRELLNIVQHPSGRMKEVALRENKVVFQNSQVIHYESDTEPGSSGAPVYNDAWELLALHHAANGNSNEGIKFSAIASAIEQDAQRGDASAQDLLKLFRGTDELMGFFGSLGRSVNPGASGLERVVDAYEGEAQDLDIGFWNVEWFNKRWQDKLDAVARVVVEMNLDVWVFVESSEEATQALADHLAANYAGTWGVLSSQDAASELQITTVLWNKKTSSVVRKEWPAHVHRWFQVDSRRFDELGLEAVHGKVFDRYPARYEVSAQFPQGAVSFNLVPVHLKAKDEGSLRRQMASRLLAEAIAEVAKQDQTEGDWVVGGDFNATLASGDLDALSHGGLSALSAHDADDQQITYVKNPFKSLIDHIFVSPNLAAEGEDDFVIVALDRKIDRFLDVSDHRPILMRLTAGAEAAVAAGDGLTEEETQRLLRGLRERNRPTTSVESALSRVLEQRVYYEVDADTVLRRAYWGDLKPTTSGFEAKLRALLTSTHAKKLPYDPSKLVYPWVDLQSNGNLRSIYSGVESTPEAYIEHDLEMDRLRTRTLESLRAESTTAGVAELEAELEAQFKYNCEHVVPQSWFGKAQPMRGDLHHLFACDSRCNSFRSNYPYTTHELERTMEDCGRLEEDLFEPKGGKGAAARATLYFLVRYPGFAGRRYSGERLQNLLRWNEEFPPDEWERHRNVAIHALQGNRNPFIDYPDWATSLKFGN